MLSSQLVTEVDKAVQTFIEQQISKKYPEHELYVSVMEICGVIGKTRRRSRSGICARARYGR